jgi:hypothetical protein
LSCSVGSHHQSVADLFSIYFILMTSLATRPVMSAFDGHGNSFHAQDQTASVLRVAAGTGTITQIPVSEWYQASGPGVESAPDGSVWVCSLTNDDGVLLRFARGSVTPEPFMKFHHHLIATQQKRRIIHLAFSKVGLNSSRPVNTMYILTSSLLLPGEESMPEEVIAYEFSTGWEAAFQSNSASFGFGAGVGADEVRATAPAWTVQLPSPAPRSATHRIAVGETSPGKLSLLVTGLIGDAIFQITHTQQNSSSNTTFSVL